MDWVKISRIIASPELPDDAVRFYSLVLSTIKENDGYFGISVNSRPQGDSRAAELLAGVVGESHPWPHRQARVSEYLKTLISEGVILWGVYTDDERGLMVGFWPDGMPEHPHVDTFDPDGYVYLAHSSTGHYKIGRSKRPEERIKHFDTQMPVAVSKVHEFPADPVVEAERRLHELLSHRRVKGEWFELSDSQVDLLTSLARYQDGTWETVIEEEVTLPGGDTFPRYTEEIPESVLVHDS